MHTVPATVETWLAALTPLPPPALAARLRELLQPYWHRPAQDIPDVLVEAAEGALQQLLAANATSRESALDLLTIDALITYAFEVCADAPGEIEVRTRDAMIRIANVPTAIGNEP